MIMRKLGWVALPVAVFVLAASGGWTVAGQERSDTPPLVITAFGGKAGGLQGAAHAVGRSGPAGRVVERRHGERPDGRWRWPRGGRGAPRAAPDRPQPLYLDDAALQARLEQVKRGANQRDTSAESTFRFDYARRVFPQTRLIVDPPDGRLPAIKPEAQGRLMPRGTYGPGPLDSWEDFSLYERCITRGIAGSILRVIYGNGNRIVQAPGVVAFSYEMLPDTRIFYTDGRPHINQRIREYLGDSRARWEGEELVVETTNLTEPDRDRRQRQRRPPQRADEDHRAVPPRGRRHHSVPGDVRRSG